MGWRMAHSRNLEGTGQQRGFAPILGIQYESHCACVCVCSFVYEYCVQMEVNARRLSQSGLPYFLRQALSQNLELSERPD